MTDIITFDTAYFQELIKDLGNASRYLIEAKISLQKASVGLDSGLVAFALCLKLGDDIKQIKKSTGVCINETNGLSKVLENGITRINGWETTTKNRESGLAARLGKIWGFENGNFTSGAPSGTVGGNTAEGGEIAQNMNSSYYSRTDLSAPRILDNGRMNCVYYARARAMEVNQMTEWTGGNQGQSVIRANSIATFLDSSGGRHDVFIESVEYDGNNQPVRVTLSESNMGNHPDGRITTVDWEDFETRDGKRVSSYTYF